MREVTDASFEQDVLNAEKPVLVDFWAAWCAPCRRVAPVLEQIQAEHGDKLEIVKLNVDENPRITAKYGVTALPTLAVYSGGELVKTVIGAKPKPAIEADLASVLA